MNGSGLGVVTLDCSCTAGINGTTGVAMGVVGAGVTGVLVGTIGVFGGSVEDAVDGVVLLLLKSGVNKLRLVLS